MDFFQRIRPDPDIALGYVALLDAIDLHLARAAGTRDPVAKEAHKRKAKQVTEVLRTMQAGYRRLGTRQAAQADQMIRNRLASTAVRGPTTGRLERAIKSIEIPTPAAWPAASIGVASIEELDRGAVNPRGKGRYWRSQEYGLPVLPQRPAPGYFDSSVGAGNYSAPDPGQFRNHPYFEQMAYTKGMPALVRKQPLAARHFLRDGTNDFIAWRLSERRRIEDRAITELRRINAT